MSDAGRLDPLRHSSLVARHLTAGRARRRGAGGWLADRLAEARALPSGQWRRLGLVAALYAVFAVMVMAIVSVPGGLGAGRDGGERDDRGGGLAAGPVPTLVAPTATARPTPSVAAPPTPTTPATTSAPTPRPTPVSEVAPALGTPEGLVASATVADAAPPATGPVTVTGTLRRGAVGVAGVPLRSVWRFRSGEVTCDGPATDAAGEASCAFELVDATPGYPVVVEVLFEVDGRTYRARATFTPR